MLVTGVQHDSVFGMSSFNVEHMNINFFPSYEYIGIGTF